ncbi:MAG: 3-dehydroquinate synthase [Pseudomonadota bacterium]|nr:3-dehydroquinate synthase [Pseudomonadota bacterium]
MEIVKVTLSNNEYEILIGDGVIESLSSMKEIFKSKKILVLTDKNIATLYNDKIQKFINPRNHFKYVLDPGEEQKNLYNFERILEFMLTKNFDRDSLIVAFGGGVIGDLGGFVASCYQRGINVIQIPTTLLAQVDSSVGGKTAVNHVLGKNMIGTFHQPLRVICDVSFLETLPQREYISGIAEIIKYGVIGDLKFFNWLEQNTSKLLRRDSQTLKYAVKRSCENKKDIVNEDEKEKGKRALLNFGHTFGHAVENLTGYNTWLHGEAVSIGMCMAAKLSKDLGLIDQESSERVINLLKKYGLPVKSDSLFDVKKFLDVMSLDKKNHDGKINLILLNDLGFAVKKSDIPTKMIVGVING